MKTRRAVIIALLAAACGCAGPTVGGRSLSAWRADLKSSRVETQSAAIDACTQMGPKAEDAIPELVTILKGGDPLATKAGVALSSIGAKSFEPVVAASGDSNPRVRTEALRTIGKLAERGPIDATKVVDELLRHVDDPEERVRAVSLAYLGDVHANASRVVPVLAKALDDPSALVRMNACVALGRFGKESAPAVPALLRARLDPEKDVRAAAESTLLYHPDAKAAQ